MNHRWKQSVKRFHLVKRLAGWWRAGETAVFQRRWARMTRDIHPARPRTDRAATRILLATSLGAYQPGTRLDSVLAAALRLRGADVSVWLCDAALPACQLSDVYFYPNRRQFAAQGPRRDLCPTCFRPAANLFAALDLHVHRMSAYLTPERVAAASRLAAATPAVEIPTYRQDSIPIGEQAVAGTLRFFASGQWVDEPGGEGVLRSYFRAALLTAAAFSAALEANRWDCVVMHHALYVPQGVIADLCRARGIRVAAWHPAYRKNCFTFTEGDTYHRAMITEPTAAWEGLTWTPELDRGLMDYLDSRHRGTRDWIVFSRDPQVDIEDIAAAWHLDPRKPWIGMLTNVMWDAQLHYPVNAFSTMRDWVLHTIEYFARRPDLQLIIRVHPAEVSGRLPARQRIADEIANVYPTLPENVVLIPPDSPVSTYALMLNCDTALIYATKMGVELAAYGIPVITAGEAWIRHKGFSLDASTPQEYERLLDQLPLRRRIDGETLIRARKYAFHYFFRRMIPLKFIHPRPGLSLAFDVALHTMEELRSGRSPGLDVICDGILHRTDFIYPAEREDMTVHEPQMMLP